MKKEAKLTTISEEMKTKIEVRISQIEEEICDQISQKYVEEILGVCEENWRFAKKLCVAYSFRSASFGPGFLKSCH